MYRAREPRRRDAVEPVIFRLQTRGSRYRDRVVVRVSIQEAGAFRTARVRTGRQCRVSSTPNQAPDRSPEHWRRDNPSTPGNRVCQTDNRVCNRHPKECVPLAARRTRLRCVEEQTVHLISGSGTGIGCAAEVEREEVGQADDLGGDGGAVAEMSEQRIHACDVGEIGDAADD